MTKFDKPSSINKIKDHKLTKRRLVKALSAAGFGASTVNALTVDDVRAADSDQVTIAITCDGSRKVRVSSDWYDHLVRARSAKEKIENNWLHSGNGEKDRHNDVFAVWLDAGTGTNNPHVIVTIDRNSSTKDETRGNVPERRNDVRVAVEEAPREYESMACEPKCKEDDTEMPGGLEVCFDGGCGTLGPQAYDYNNSEWVLTTAAHVPAEDGQCGDDLIGEDAQHCNSLIGDVKEIAHSHDMCIIRPLIAEPMPEVWNPSDHSDRWKTITQTLNANGVDYWMEHDRKVWKYGKGTCHSEGLVHARGTKEDPFVNNPCTTGSETWNDCVRWGSFGDLGGGDSGSIAFGADPYSDDYLACCQNSWQWFNYAAGPAGYAWTNKYGYEWRTFTRD